MARFHHFLAAFAASLSAFFFAFLCKSLFDIAIFSVTSGGIQTFILLLNFAVGRLFTQVPHSALLPSPMSISFRQFAQMPSFFFSIPYLEGLGLYSLRGCKMGKFAENALLEHILTVWLPERSFIAPLLNQYRQNEGFRFNKGRKKGSKKGPRCRQDVFPSPKALDYKRP